MSVHCSPKIVTENLLIYLDAANQKSYPKYGLDKWGDMTKNGNHFSMQGNLTNDTESFIFTENIDNYFSSSNLIHPASELTIEMWVLPDTNSTGDAFYSFISENPTGVNHYLANQSNLTIFGPNFSLTTGISILDQGWTHVVRTSLRSTGTEKIYINGDIRYENSLSATIPFSTSGYFLLGQRPGSGGTLDTAYAYAGKIAIFKVYNTVLIDDAIKENFIALRRRFYY